LVEYDEERIRLYRIYILHTNVLDITTHVTIDEEYMKLQGMYPFHPNQTTFSHTPSHVYTTEPPVEIKAVSNYEYLIGTTHIDDEDGMLY